MTILQSLDRYYERMAARGEVAQPGYSVEAVGVVLFLSATGALIDVQVLTDSTGKRPRANRVPKWFGRSGNGSNPYFLWDNSAYVLGVSNKDPAKTLRDHLAFRDFHLEELKDEADPGLHAVRLFLEDWEPDHFKAPLFNERMLTWNFAFRLEGDLGLVHERPAAAVHVERLRSLAPSADLTSCLVTGRSAPPVRLHPKIKGVDGTASAEVPLVSFNAEAFESYGKSQGFNAPTSEDAAFRYGAALNRLLDRNKPSNRLKIADATVAFWADASGVDEHTAEAAEQIFASFFSPAVKDVDEEKLGVDEGQAAKLRDALRDVAAGRALKDIDPRLTDGVQFHVLGLAPNAARLSVRYWLEDSFEVFARRLAEHYDDVAIEPAPWRATLPAVQRLLVKTTALQEKFENIPPLLAGEMMRGVLGGGRYPRTLLTAALTRLRAGDDPAKGWHAAAIKACINRDHRLSHPEAKEPLTVSLDPDNPSPAYQLGRLFAVLESAQFAALGKVNAPISDRYYGSASSTPARVFGTLIRGGRKHISDAHKRGKGRWLDSRLTEIIARLPATLPTSLRTEDQGRFAVGYYHERAFRPAKAEVDAETLEPTEVDNPEMPDGAH